MISTTLLLKTILNLQKITQLLIGLSDFLILKWEKRGIEKVNML